MTDAQAPFPLGHGSVMITTKRGREARIRHIAAADAGLLVDLYNSEIHQGETTLIIELSDL